MIGISEEFSSWGVREERSIPRILSGMTDFLSKPFQPEDLRQKIDQYVLTNGHSEERGILLNSDLYTESDLEFKREFELLLVKNIQELQEALKKSIVMDDAEVFRKGLSKVRATISMLGDKEFEKIIENITDLLTDLSNRREELILYTDKFNLISKRIISGLQENIQTL